MTIIDLTRIDGVDAFTTLKVVSEIGTDMSEWPSVGALRVVAEVDRQQPHHWCQGAQFPDQAQRQQNGQRVAPLRQLPGRLPAQEESPYGSDQVHHGHGQQAGQSLLGHATGSPIGLRPDSHS